MSEGKKEILLGDCLELMKDIPNGSIDMILCDLPYGTTSQKWDIVIPLDKLWEQYERIIKPNGCIILFGKNPFTAKMILSNEELFKYELIWEKTRAGNNMQVCKQPSAIHENILVFYKKQPTYNDLKFAVDDKYIDKRKSINHSFYSNGHYKGVMKRKVDDGLRHPQSVLPFNSVWKKGMHPTEKPVELFEWLIKSYTNENDLVLDNTAGSGTTAIACLNTNRKFIVMEKEPEYYDIIKKRVEDFNKNFEPKTLFDAQS